MDGDEDYLGCIVLFICAALAILFVVAAFHFTIKHW